MRQTWAALAIVVLLSAARFASGDPTYEVIDLGVLPGAGYSQGFDINEASQIVGPSGDYCFLWDPVAGMEDLGTLGGPLAVANGVSDAGHVAGYSYICGDCYISHAFLWTSNGMQDLGTLGGTRSFGESVNRHGHVVGSSDTAARVTHAFLWENDMMIDLGTFGGRSSMAFDINDSKQVVGFADHGTGPRRAFLWKEGVMYNLGDLGGKGSIAEAINDNAQVVGHSSLTNGINHAFLWSEGVMTDLGTVAGFESSLARDINNHGEIVGFVGDNVSQTRAFLYRNNVMIDLNQLISAESGWVLLEATGINDAGMITGWGMRNGQSRAFLLAPATPKANLGINANNAGDMRPGTPDVDFTIDEHDELIEDDIGFSFWWSPLDGYPLTPANMVDAVPFVVDVPEELFDAGYKFYLKLGGVANLSSLYVYPSVTGTNGNRRAFLQTPSAAQIQLAERTLIILDNGGSAEELEITRAGKHEFLFRAIGEGHANGTLSVFAEEPDTTTRILHDSIKLNFKPATDYWLYVSARHAAPDTAFSYPTEDGRSVTLQRYADAVETSGTLDVNKTTYFVFVHGYANSLDFARESNNEYFKRLYWLGFRGNYVGFAWEGNEGEIGPATLFDPNVENAFQSAPSLRNFLISLRNDRGASRIDVMAHSLGNLVMWETLRLHDSLGGGVPLVNNVISVEAAVWREAFDAQSNLSYASPSDPITYAVTQLKQQSWRSWFNQTGNDPRTALQGRPFNSYVGDDHALELAMRLNDWLMRGYRRLRFWQYDRAELEHNPPVYRTPVGQNSLAYVVPALLQTGSRDRFYSHASLNLPIGTAVNSQAQWNYSAIDSGWRTGKHSDFRDLALPNIYKWYRIYLAGQADDDLGEPIFKEAVPMGKE